MSHPDTIVAAATPPGRGGVGVVRVSGPKTPRDRRDAGRRTAGARATPRCRASSMRAGNPIDIGIALFFPGPHSYTGEHVLELQGHGGPVIVEQLIERCHRARRAPRAARRIHRARVSQRQDRSRAGRSRRRSHRRRLARSRARRHALAAGRVLEHGAGAHRCADRPAHLRRSRHRFSRGGGRLPRRRRAARAASYRARPFRRRRQRRPARAGCCATA